VRRVAEANGIRVKAYSGTTGVLLAFDVEPGRREDLLGFAISREITTGSLAGRIGWLQGMLDFPGTTKGKGELLATNVAPIQKFRWSDYAVYPGTGYAYTVQPVYKLASIDRVTAADRRTFLEAGPRVEIATQGFDGEDMIMFNRAVAASQAFSRRFPDLDAEIEAARAAGTLGDKSLPQRALDWLSRGLLERMEAFVGEALDATWAIDLAIFEYHLPRLHSAMVKAAQRGVKVRILYHGAAGDEAAAENEHLLQHPAIPNAELFPRVTTALMHNKFAVLSRIDGTGRRTPVAVLAGSTNWSENGCYRQANVIHVARAPSVLESYAAMFEALVETRGNRGDTKRWINKHNPLPTSPERFVGFSPRSNRAVHGSGAVAGRHRGVAEGDHGGPEGQHTRAHEGDCNRRHLRGAHRHFRFAQPVHQCLGQERRELHDRAPRPAHRRCVPVRDHARLRSLPLPIQRQGTGHARQSGGSAATRRRRQLDGRLLHGRAPEGTGPPEVCRCIKGVPEGI
jgi:hypothetical protein